MRLKNIVDGKKINISLPLVLIKECFNLFFDPKKGILGLILKKLLTK